MLDLEKLGIKSAEILTDYSAMETALEDAHKKFVKAVGNNPVALASTQLLRDGDERLVIAKRSNAAGLVRGYKLPDPATLRQKAEALGVKWRDGLEKRIKPFWASDERVDRHGDILEQSWKFDDFEDNPLFLFGHAWDGLPIGKTIDWEVVQRKDAKYDGDALRLLCLYATKEEWEWADTVYRMSDAGYIQTGSVGAYPGEVINVKDTAERSKLGLGPFGFILRNNALVEFSQVTVPANTGAHVLNSMKSAGKLKPTDVQVLRELHRRQLMLSEGTERQWARVDAELRMQWRSLFRDVKTHEHKDVDLPLLLEEIEVGGRGAAGDSSRRSPSRRSSSPDSGTTDSSDDSVEDSIDTKDASLDDDIPATLEGISEALTGLRKDVRETRHSTEELSQAVEDIREAQENGGPAKEPSSRGGALANILQHRDKK